MPQRYAFRLDRKLSEKDGFGLWEFHRSQSSYTVPVCVTYRHAQLSPPEPGEGKTVKVFICSPGMSQNEWMEAGEGIAAYESDK